jgi:ABC-type polysaccharide/polyol phosphate transport system ATPase subunit
MADDLAISVENVSKAYRIWNDPAARLKSPLCDGLAACLPPHGPARAKLKAKAQSYYRDFYALKDISFQVRKGESVGIIGRNGSGKSTLLQIIAGTLQPTLGSIQVRGRVAALLELGSGFNPEFTGRENVYLNAAVLGLTRAETEERFDSIADFADIGDFLDQPVRTYSSGMMVRLAFAVATASKPEVLVVDEALSVGDIFFQQKASRRINEILEGGTTFLLVSHDVSAIRALTHRAVVLRHGAVDFAGSPGEAVARYFYMSRSALPDEKIEPTTEVAPLANVSDETRQRLFEQNVLGLAKSRMGEQEIILRAATIALDGLSGAFDGPVGCILEVDYLIVGVERVTTPHVNIHIHDRFSNLLFASSSAQTALTIGSVQPGEERAVRLKIQLCMQPGEYTLDLGVGESVPGQPSIGLPQDRHLGIGPIRVTHNPSDPIPFHGMVQLPLVAQTL